MIEERPLPWQEILEIVFRRYRVILLGVTAGVLAGFFVNWLRPPLYTAGAQVQLTAQAVPGPRVDAMPATQIQAEMALLQSPTLVRSVLEAYRQDAQVETPPSSAFVRARALVVDLLRNPLGRLEGIPPERTLELEVQSLVDRIATEPVERSNVVRVSFTGEDPQWAARFVNDLLAHHIERIARLNEQSGARSFYRRQLEILGQRWQEASNALTAFRERQGASLLAGDETQMRQVLANLEAERVRAETQVLELRRRVEFLAEEIQRHPKTIEAESRVTENQVVQDLKRRILELEMERGERLSRYTPTSTMVRELDAQIEAANALLATKEQETTERMTAANPSYQALEVDLVQTRASLTSAQARAAALASQTASYREKLSRLEGSAAELERLENEVAAAREAYQTYQRREEEARLSSAYDESGNVNMFIAQPAEAPVTPVDSNEVGILLAAVAAGLLLGLALAFARDWLDPRVKSSVQAQRLSRLPVIAEIPY